MKLYTVRRPKKKGICKITVPDAKLATAYLHVPRQMFVQRAQRDFPQHVLGAEGWVKDSCRKYRAGGSMF